MAMLVMLTVIQQQELHHYFKNCHYADLLISYLPSKNFSIGKLAKISLAFLYRQLDPVQATEHLHLSSKDASIILKILSDHELTEDEKTEFWHYFSPDGLTGALKGFCFLKANCDSFLKQGGLHALGSLLDSTDTDVQEATLVLLWQLASTSRSAILQPSEQRALVDKIQRLAVGEECDLQTLAVCVPLCSVDTLPEGTY